MRVLADNGGYVLAEVDDRLLFFERSIIPTWMVYVPGLMTVIGVANVVIQIIVGNVVAAGVILAIALASAAALRAAVRSRRRARARPLDVQDAVVQLDLGGRRLLEGDGHVLASLDQTRVEKSMQLTSSARALTISWPGGKRVVYRGDALALHGSIDGPAEVLKARGLPTTW